MRTKLQLRTVTAGLILIALMSAASAQPGPIINPATGLPMPEGLVVLNPSTGLPETPPAQTEPLWISTNWPDPPLILTNVFYDGLPLSEVARHLRECFKDDFDILPMPKTPGADGEDWGEQTMNLQLHNVRASDVFNAMNMVFENDRTPLRWKLDWNYNRPIVQLVVLPGAAQELVRRVYFVGNLLGDEKSGGMTMEQLVQVISQVWQTAYGSPEPTIQFHKEAQLIIFKGTPEQADFVKETLEALNHKASWEREKQRGADAQSRTDGSRSGPKSGGGGGSE